MQRRQATTLNWRETSCTIAKLSWANIMKIATRSEYASPSLDFATCLRFTAVRACIRKLPSLWLLERFSLWSWRVLHPVGTASCFFDVFSAAAALYQATRAEISADDQWTFGRASVLRCVLGFSGDLAPHDMLAFESSDAVLAEGRGGCCRLPYS